MFGNISLHAMAYSGGGGEGVKIFTHEHVHCACKKMSSSRTCPQGEGGRPHAQRSLCPLKMTRIYRCKKTTLSANRLGGGGFRA